MNWKKAVTTYEDYSETNLQWAVNKRSNEEKNAKNTYILKLLLNTVTTGIEALVLGNKFFMPVTKKSAACELSHILYCETLKKKMHGPNGVECWYPV
jgi:hypothetical protein